MLILKNKPINNLYELFNCKSKEELHSLVKEGAEEVRSLLNYIDYAKGNIANKNERITSPVILGEYLSAIDFPREEKATILFADTKNQPLLLERIDLCKKEAIINVMKKGVISGANSAFLAVDSLINLRAKIEIFRNMTETLGIKLIDVMHCNDKDKTMYTEKGKDEINNLSKRSIISYDNENNFIDYSAKEEYLNYTNYYAKKKIKDLHIVKDIKEIKDIMKVGYQHNKQEIFGCIIYNENNQIMEVKDISMGGINAAVVDPRIILRNLINIDELKGVAFYHNHPSGNPSPSKEDVGITHRLIDNLKNFDIEYFDHFIIGKEKVFSFVDEVFGCESMNLEYQNSTFAREEEEKYFLNNPIGKTPFTKQENDFYSGLTDTELMNLYVEERRASNFVNPQTFEVMRSRSLISKGDKVEDIEKRLDDILMQKQFRR